MKNNFLIILIIFQFLFLNKVFAKEIEFDATDIEITDNQNLTVANNGIAKIKDDKVVIEGIKIKYFKDKSLIVVSEGKISKIDLNIEINSGTIRYNIKTGKINFINDVIINDETNNLLIYSEKIIYDINDQKIFGESNTKIIDEFENNYELSKFEYSTKDKIIKLTNTKVSDKDKNTFDLESAYLDLYKKEIVAKDIGLNFNISENSENEPRLKGRSLVGDKNNTIVKKGVFTFCKKRKNVLHGK